MRRASAEDMLLLMMCAMATTPRDLRVRAAVCAENGGR
jgi:hypothetical protein